MTKCDWLRPSPAVRWMRSGDIAFLLDLNSGKFLAFEAIAVLFWSAIIRGEGIERFTAQIADAYAVPPDRVAADLADFRSALIARNLLTATTPPPPVESESAATLGNPRRLARVPAFLHAATTLLRIRYALHQYGFRHAYDVAVSAAAIRPYSRHHRGWTSGSTSQIESLTRTFLRLYAVASRGRNSTDCLPRSLALFVFLRERGINATHVIGLRPRPFVAHAWVEVEGAPALEDEARISLFQRLAVLS